MTAMQGCSLQTVNFVNNPFLLAGKPLDLPIAKKEGKPSWVVGNGDDSKTTLLTANLSSFVESLRQTANSVDVEELVQRANPNGMRKAKQGTT